jgi:hypothetical protein
LICVLVTGAATAFAAAAPETPNNGRFGTGGLRQTDESYPYASAAFALLVADSYRETATSGIQSFPAWFETAYAASSARLPGFHHLPLIQALAARAKQIRSIPDAHQRSGLEADTGIWLHHAIKTIIPGFSLDRGYEFANVVRFGERQCLLQSTLIAALLQTAGIRAGVYMVWKNPHGAVSNNGHAVTTAKLSDGRDLLVDASEAAPFARHQGVFVRDATTQRYRFAEPVYGAGSAIIAYRRAAGGRPLSPGETRPLDIRFVRSQLYFYRGERVPGGLLGKPRTSVGLAASARFLERAELERPENALAVYVLGHVYLRQDKTREAAQQYAKGFALYREFGYVPAGPRTAYARATR